MFKNLKFDEFMNVDEFDWDFDHYQSQLLHLLRLAFDAGWDAAMHSPKPKAELIVLKNIK